MRGARSIFIILAVGDIVTAVAAAAFLQWPWGVVIALVVLAVTAVLYRAFLRPLMRAEAVLEHGEPAEATVLQMWDTGWTVNENPQVGLRLAVRPVMGVPYEVETKSVVSRLVVGQLEPGAVVQVRYDPKDPQRVVVLPDAGVRGAARGPAERLEALEELRLRRLVTEEEYRRKRQEILDEV
jgi:hypothetical protein